MDGISASETAGLFANTQWTMVLRAKDGRPAVEGDLTTRNETK
jgi:hypothetical protein